MAIKEENVRVTITLTPNQVSLLRSIMNVKKCKTYGKALDYVLDNFRISLDLFLKNME